MVTAYDRWLGTPRAGVISQDLTGDCAEDCKRVQSWDCKRSTDEITLEKLVRASVWIANNIDNPDCKAVAELMIDVVSS